MQSALLLQDPKVAEQMGQALAHHFQSKKVSAVISPAIGGLIIGHETARALGVRGIFAEKDDQGAVVLRRGFEILPGENILIVEDVITTGLSTGEVIKLVESYGGKVVGIGCVVNRSETQGIPGLGEKWQNEAKSLLRLEIKSWPANDCQLCKKNIPAVKPGSRKKT